MKFIHTADLHLGNKMHDVDREEEYKAFFAWLKDRIVLENVDVLVISGDIYDTINPPLEARKIFNKFLAALLETHCKNVIIVGGNHDSSALLDSNKDLMEALNIHIVGSISNLKIEDTVFKLYDEKEKIIGVCAAIPFMKESDLRHFCTKESDVADQAYAVIYRETLKVAKEIRGNLDIPIITTGHLYATDLEGRYSKTVQVERPDDGVRTLDVVGNLGNVHVSAFPSEYDYVALGHIHYHTKVAGNPKIRYSGSPFVMGFDEADIPRQILLVECEKEGETSVTPIEVPSIYKFRTYSGNAEMLQESIHYLIEEIHPDEKVYVECRYKLEDSGKVNRMIDELSLPENIQIVSTKILRSTNVFQTALGSRTMREMQELDPEEIFESFILSKILGDVEDSQKKEEINKYLPYFMEAYEEVLRGMGDENH